MDRAWGIGRLSASYAITDELLLACLLEDCIMPLGHERPQAHLCGSDVMLLARMHGTPKEVPGRAIHCVGIRAPSADAQESCAG